MWLNLYHVLYIQEKSPTNASSLPAYLYCSWPFSLSLFLRMTKIQSSVLLVTLQIPEYQVWILINLCHASDSKETFLLTISSNVKF